MNVNENSDRISTKTTGGMMPKILIGLFTVISCLFFTCQGYGEIYKWVDQNGVVHFSDTPPPAGQKAETMNLPKDPAPGPDSVPKQPEQFTKPTRKQSSSVKVEEKRRTYKNLSNKVEIYVTDWCRYCKSAIAFLRSNDIEFQQYDIEKESNAAKRMYELGGKGGVPFAVINGRILTGFSSESYREALGMR